MCESSSFIQCLKLRICVCICSLFAALTPVAHAQQIQPSASYAAEVIDLWQELQAIDSWECDLFKPKAWDTIANSLSWALSQKSVELVRKDNFAILRDAPAFKIKYDEYRKAIEKAAATPGDGKVELALEDMTVEVLWTLQHIGPMLDLALDEKLKTDPNWLRLATADTAVVRQLVEEAINRYAANQRRLDKLRVLTGLPIELRRALGIDASRYADWLKRWEGPDFAEVEDLTIIDVRQTMVCADILRELEPSIVAELVRITKLLEPQIATVQRAMEEIQRSARVAYLDCPPGLPDDAPRIRFVLKWPGNADAHSYPSAELVLVLPRPEQSAFAVRDATDLKSKVVKAQGEASAADEYPLGIRISEVAVQEDGTPRIISGPLNNISLHDQHVLAMSLQRLGLPRELDVLSLDVIPNELRHDHIPLIARLRLPLGDAPVEVRIVIEPGQLVARVDPKQVLRQIAAEPLKQLQDELLRRLKKPEAWLTSASGALVRTVRIDVLNDDWLGGQLSARAAVKAFGADWQVPLVLENADGRWRLVPGPVLVPGTIADQIGAEVRKRLQTALAMAAGDFDLIQRYVTIESLSYDARMHQISGVAHLNCDAVTPAVTAQAPFSLGLSDGSVTVDFGQVIDTLKDDVRKRLLESIRLAITGAVDQRLLDNIQAASFDVAGLTMRVTDARYDSALKRFAIDAEVLSHGKPIMAAGKAIRVRTLYLTSVEFGPDGKPKPPTFDFSDCKVEPGLEQLLGVVAGLKPDWLKISQTRGTPKGITFFAELAIKGLDWPIPLGQLTLGTGGIKWSHDAIVKSITDSATQALKNRNLTVGDIGPVKRITLHTLTIADPLTLELDGDVELPAELTLQLRIKVQMPLSVEGQPTLSVTLLNDPTKVITDTLGRLLPEGSVPGITKVTFLHQRPYGVEFDIKVDAWCFTIGANGLQIRQDGVHLPATLRVTIPATVPLPGGLAIVNPGVGLPLGNGAAGGKLEILGDLTYGGKGLEKILRVASEMSGSLKDLRFEVNGRTIVLNFLPVFQVQGLTELGKGRFEVNAQTVGFLDKVFSVRGRQVVDGSKRLVSQESQLAVFGFRIADVPMTLRVVDSGVHLDAKSRIALPIASADAEFSGTFPKLSDLKASAGVKAKVSRFTLGNALVEIQWSRATLGFEVLSFKLTLVTPGPLGLTPSHVLKAILKIFDFNLDFSALLRREIVVNLVDETGKKSHSTVGNGEPPPPGDPTDDNTNPGGKPPTSEEKEKRDAMGDPPPPPGAKPDKAPSRKPPVLGAAGHPQVPTSVYAYRSGSSAIQFDDLNNGLFRVIVVSEGGHRWMTHWIVTAASKELLEASLILDEVRLRTVDSQGNGRWTCANNIQHDWTEALVTLQQSGGAYKVHAVPMRPDLSYRELQGADNPIPRILENVPGQTFWEWVTGQTRPLQPGDITLIREWARSRLHDRYNGFGQIARQDVSAWSNALGAKLSGANGYFFHRINDQGQKSAVFAVRNSGLQIEAVEGEMLYSCMMGAGSDEHLQKIFVLFLEGRLTGRNVSFVHTADEPPGPAKQLNRVLLHLRSTKDGPEELVSVVRGTPSVKRARLHLPGGSGLPADPNDPLLLKLVQAFDLLGPDDVWVGAAGRDRRALLGGKLGADDWWMMPVYFDGPPGKLQLRPADPAAARVAGSVISARYQLTDPAIGQSPRTLDTEADRRWFAERLFDDSQSWAKHLKDNPLPLALPQAK